MKWLKKLLSPKNLGLGKDISMFELEDSLATLKDRGYIVIGIHMKRPSSVDLLLIHESWTEFKWRDNFSQAWDDLPDLITTNFMITIEPPTLEMYKKDRIGGPEHKIIYSREV